MPAKMRLQRRGKKGRPFYHIVIADGRAPRDGKYIESIGTYDPLTNPATIDLAFDKAIEWIRKGAQPSETVRSLLKHQGVLYKIHLNKGVEKKALTQDQADEKFNTWMEEKKQQISAKVNELQKSKNEETRKRKDAESKVKEERAKAIEEKLKKEKEAEIAAKEKEAADNAASEAPAEKEEAAEEAATENKAEEPKAEPKPETTEAENKEVDNKEVENKEEAPKE